MLIKYIHGTRLKEHKLPFASLILKQLLEDAQSVAIQFIPGADLIL